MADANAVIQALGQQLAQALIAKTIAEVEVNELRLAALEGAGVEIPLGTVEDAGPQEK